MEEWKERDREGGESISQARREKERGRLIRDRLYVMECRREEKRKKRDKLWNRKNNKKIKVYTREKRRIKKEK